MNINTIHYNSEKDDCKKIKVDYNIIQDAINIANGVYKPLVGFLKRDDYQSVLDNMRLADGSVWSIPIVFDINKDEYDAVKNEEFIRLYSDQNDSEVTLKIEEVYPFEKDEMTRKVFGTIDREHPGVNEIYCKKDFLVGGEIIEVKDSFDKFKDYLLTPQNTRNLFNDKGWETVVAFQTRNFPHRSHEYLQLEALKNADGLFIQPVIGKKKKGDIRDELILESYKLLIEKYYPEGKVHLGILPIRMHYAGPREAVMHAIIRRNYGCTHMIIGRDHAGVGNYYAPYEAHSIFDNFSKDDLGIDILKYNNVHYCADCNSLVFEDECSHDHDKKMHLSGTMIREMIGKGEKLPENLIRPEISNLLINHPNPFVE